jgi:ribosome-binding protein aMBF1 (putative translation factor)
LHGHKSQIDKKNGADVPIQRLDENAFSSSELLRSISARLEEYRARRRWSVLKLARTCGVSHAFITHILELRANPSVLILQKIANNLEVSTAWLCGHSNETPDILSENKD